MIERKKKICIQCGDPRYIWSHGRCKQCATFNEIKQRPKKLYIAPMSDKMKKKFIEY